MAREILKPEMAMILEPLEKRFKTLSKDQGDIYHSRLCYLRKEYLEQAVEYLVDSSRTFPTPGEIKAAYREASAHVTNAERSSSMVQGCAHCDRGWVTFIQAARDARPDMSEKDFLLSADTEYKFSHPCAYCFKYHRMPQVIARDGVVYWASSKVGDRYVQELNRIEPVLGARLS